MSDIEYMKCPKCGYAACESKVTETDKGSYRTEYCSECEYMDVILMMFSGGNKNVDSRENKERSDSSY
jgi:hypothetical protein